MIMFCSYPPRTPGLATIHSHSQIHNLKEMGVFSALAALAFATCAAGPARVSIQPQTKALSPVLYSMFLETEINYGGEGARTTTPT